MKEATIIRLSFHSCDAMTPGTVRKHWPPHTFYLHRAHCLPLATWSAENSEWESNGCLALKTASCIPTFTSNNPYRSFNYGQCQCKTQLQHQAISRVAKCNLRQQSITTRHRQFSFPFLRFFFTIFDYTLFHHTSYYSISSVHCHSLTHFLTHLLTITLSLILTCFPPNVFFFPALSFPTTHPYYLSLISLLHVSPHFQWFHSSPPGSPPVTIYKVFKFVPFPPLHFCTPLECTRVRHLSFGPLQHQSE